MLKSFRLFLAIIIAAAVLTGCTKKQYPTPVDTEMGGKSSWNNQNKTKGSGYNSNSGSRNFRGNIIPDTSLATGDGNDWGIANRNNRGGNGNGFGNRSGNDNDGSEGIPGLESRNKAGEAPLFDKTGYFNGQKMFRDDLESVYFAFDSSAISASERSKLQGAAQYLLENAGENLLIEGHADWYGTADYNLALGERRANSARDYLTTLGVSDLRVNTLSKGSLEATPGLAKDQSAEDRRVDLIILK